MDGVKQLGAWTWHPASRFRRRCASGHMPGRRKATEMIQTNYVYMAQQSAQTSNPPTVAGLSKNFPVVNRIAPELSPRTEIVGRHTGDETRPASFAEEK